MHVQHPLAAQLLKRKFSSWSSFCSTKEQASLWQRRQDDKGFPGAPLKLIFIKHGLFHKEITRDQCHSCQTPCLQPFFCISIPSVPVSPYRHGQGPSPEVQSWLLKRWNTRMKHTRIHCKNTQVGPMRLLNPHKVKVFLHSVGKATLRGSHHDENQRWTWWSACLFPLK